MKTCDCFNCTYGDKCSCHWCKIRKLETHLPIGVPMRSPMERCKACNVAVEGHEQSWRGRPGNPTPCPLPETYTDGRAWPATFGSYVDGKPVHMANEGDGYCFQCLGCKHYDEQDMNWGICRNPASQYEGWETFEHFTCAHFEVDDRDHAEDE